MFTNAPINIKKARLKPIENSKISIFPRLRILRIANIKMPGTKVTKIKPVTCLIKGMLKPKADNPHKIKKTIEKTNEKANFASILL